MTTEEARTIVNICGGITKVSEMMNDPHQNLRHRLSGFTKWSKEYEIKLLQAFIDLGVFHRLRRLETALKRLEREAAVVPKEGEKDVD